MLHRTRINVNIKIIAITFLTTALLFTACGAATPMISRATITVHTVQSR